jgi:hypothetical protein
MLNPFKEVQWRPDEAARRQFGRSWVIGWPVIACLFLVIGWLRRGQWDANLSFSLWLGGVGAGLGAVCWAVPAIARPFYVVWYAFACCMGLVMGNLIFGIFYFIILTAFGLVKRLFNPRSFPKGFDKTAPTYWRDVKPVADPARYYKKSQFEQAGQEKETGLVGEMLAMLRENRKLWMVPLVGFLLLLGLLVILSATGAAPFIYTLF